MPALAVLDELFECLYYASMQSEEGQLIQVTVSFYNPDEKKSFPENEIVLDRWSFTPFDEPIPLTIKSLIKLSKAADPWSSSVAIYYNEDDQLFIYGMIDQAVHTQGFVNHEVETKPAQSGFFQAAIQGIGQLSVTSDYKLIAILRQNMLVTQFLDVWRYGPISDLLENKAQSFIDNVNQFIERTFPDEDADDWISLIHSSWRDTLSRILIQIKNYHHGGALLISENAETLEIKYPMHYRRLRGAMLRFVKYTIAVDLTNERIRKQKTVINRILYDRMEVYNSKKKAANNELKGAIRFIASHSCVDGLITFDNDLTSFGFGAVIEKVHPPSKIYISSTASVKDSGLSERNSKDFGTRHQSMMTFCWQNPDAIGIVISQDGEIRVMNKYGSKLIVWENVKTQKYLKANANIYHELSALDDL